MASGRIIFKGIVAVAVALLVPGWAVAQSATGSVTAANVATASREVQPNRKSDAVNVNPNQPVTSTVNVSGSAGVAGAKASFSKSFDLKDLLHLAQKTVGAQKAVAAKKTAGAQKAMDKPNPRPAPPASRAPVARPPLPVPHKAVSPPTAPQDVASASAPVSSVAAVRTPPLPRPVAVPPAPAPKRSPLMPVAGGAAVLALLAGGGIAVGKGGAAKAARQALHRLRPPHIQARGHLAASQTHPPEFDKHKPTVAFILRPGRAETHLTFLDSDPT